MTGTATEGYGADYFALASHGYATSHIDALCHIFHEGKMYNGYSAETVTAHGAGKLGIHHLRSGVVTRGVLLDIPSVRGVEALAPGEPIFPEDLDTAENDGRGRGAGAETHFWCGRDAGGGERCTALGPRLTAWLGWMLRVWPGYTIAR